MGAQQLLIITLSVFIVGVALWAGTRAVHAMNQSNERDLVMHQITLVVGEAKGYAYRPKSVGGGEGSFIGFTPYSKLMVTSHVRVYMTTGDNWILFQGYGNIEGWDDVNPVAVVAQYDLIAGDFSTVSYVN